MSTLEAPASFALMFPFKEERSRNKERLEASLAALCELELLKQRQESRVLTALRLGTTPRDSRRGRSYERPCVMMERTPRRITVPGCRQGLGGLKGWSGERKEFGVRKGVSGYGEMHGWRR
ncbi:hypothetical protein WMY93_007757 [Mugilogobius chulae]|uniref:Uncharacterized protein n=1 Tax=Mugilogobius chulae TaxID=88201 RepID=A0AAW0PQC4_9GOBI